MNDKPPVTALCPWYGSSRLIGPHVGKALEGCNHVVVPFAGGMCELVHIDARTLLVNDKHEHVINLAEVAADSELGPRLYRELRRKAFHPDVLARAQARFTDRAEFRAPQQRWAKLEWAIDYFVTCWMSRNGEAGKAKEFDAGFSVRYDAGGGDSAVRYRNAVKSLVAWRRILARATFVCQDAFELLGKVKDTNGCGVYVDAPWPDDGAAYRHSFTDEQQAQLADMLATFRQTRVVIRYGRHPLIESLYPADRWTWTDIDGRTSGNNAKAEVLIVNRSSLGESEERQLF